MREVKGQSLEVSWRWRRGKGHARLRDVLGDLGLEGLEVGEGVFRTESTYGCEGDEFTVDIAVPIEDVDFHSR